MLQKTATVLLVDDAVEVYLTLKNVFLKGRFVLRYARTLESARTILRSSSIDLVILDRRLDDGDGVQFLQELRSLSPESMVLMLSQYGETRDRVDGLRGGADDYVRKPFFLDELTLRIERLLEKKKLPRSKQESIGSVVMDRTTGQCYSGGHVLQLHRKETLLLSLLARQPGRTVTRERLYECLWPCDRQPTNGALDVCVRRLRSALTPTNLRIATAYGIGYTLIVPHAGTITD